MPSERVQRQVDRLLDEAEAAVVARDWTRVRDTASDALTLDPENADARSLLNAAERGMGVTAPQSTSAASPPGPATSSSATQPTSFANGRYTVTRFLGEGGKKKVYLARDSLLDRDVAFALIKTEGLDEASRVRVQREAQAMGRLGAHPHIVTVFDIGEENGQPYLVLPVLAGGDVEGVIEKAPDNKLTIERAVKIAVDTCLGLEFAHAKGIVHRDLKPGNVWLTEDGRAMIGDFGLAVAVDKSRLTQAGMMVGTVSYMPPEQAMGGEVGPRSDLYSLGAMLYEMVCGRPPFVGDESVAIIGQHLNTPPVAPSWHRPDCPPALEALILRLLEKAPAKRPASAEEVRQALESVSTSARPRDPSIAVDAPASGDNPLYRRTFVGRENEVRQLQQAFDAALSGQGGLVMVVGEPGIGKTALCEQLATYVALRGGKALVGHCYEEGSLSLPYLAFVEAMRSYVLAREPDGLRSDLGTGAADVARIVSEVRDRVQGVELRPVGDPEDDRWRLLQAVTSFLRNTSTVQPLCIVLEDLHWADRGTLDLLLHVARNLQGARLLIVGTYRDVEVDRSHPLSGTLADLRRQANFHRVALRGLTIAEVHRMYESIRGQDVALQQAEIVYRQTEGHPLFVQEVLRYLVEEGIVVREDGRYQVRQADVGSPELIPEGLRDVVGKRLSHLGVSANQVLSVAAVIGREFRLDILRRVVSAPDEDLLSALEESQERAIIEPRETTGSVAFRFTHAFFRQVLYEEIFTPRRIRLHQKIGQAVEEIFERRLEEHAAELAEHFAQSVDEEDLIRAVKYAEIAAKRATSVFDYGEAVRRIEQAIKAQMVLDPEDWARLCDLELQAGEALLLLNERRRVGFEVAERAFEMAGKIPDRGRAFAACRLALDSFTDWPHAVRRQWQSRALECAPDDPSAKIRVNRSVAATLGQEGDAPESEMRLREGLELARQHGRAEEALGLMALLFSQNVDIPPDEQRRLVEEGMLLCRDGVPTLERASFLVNASGVWLGLGERHKAESCIRDIEQLAAQTRHIRAMGDAAYAQSALTFFDGDIDQAQALINKSGRAAGIVRNIRIAAMRGQPGLVAEKVDEALRLIDEQSAALLMVADACEAIQRTAIGRNDEAIRVIQDCLKKNADTYGRFGSDYLLFLLEAAVDAGDVESVEGLLATLSTKKPGLQFRYSLFCCEPLVLAGALALTGHNNEARARYDEATRFCESIADRPHRALAFLGLAELLLEHYPDEHESAIEHLDFAIGELRDMKMQPALERALRHRGLLKA